MTDATETNSGTALAVPKFTAAQIEKDCPAQLQDLAKDLRQDLEKLYEQKTLAGDQEIAVKKRIAEVIALCDVGGFKAFQKMFFPDLGKSRVYELLAIGTDKKSFKEIKASTRERVAKHRANKAEASDSVTVTDKSEPDVQGTSEEHGEIEAPSISSEQTPEPTNHRRAVAPGDEVTPKFTALILELDRRTYKRPPEHFSGTGAPKEVLLRVAKFATDVANGKQSEADAPSPVTLPYCDEAASADEQSSENMKAERPGQDAEELRQ